MLGELARKHKADGGLNLAGRESCLLVVDGKLPSLAGDALEDVVDKRVHDAVRYYQSLVPSRHGPMDLPHSVFLRLSCLFHFFLHRYLFTVHRYLFTIHRYLCTIHRYLFTGTYKYLVCQKMLNAKYFRRTHLLGSPQRKTFCALRDDLQNKRVYKISFNTILSSSSH